MLRLFYHALLFCLCGFTTIFAQSKNQEQVPVEFNVVGLGKTDLEILVVNKDAYLPILDIFKFLSIKADFDSTSRQITGFFQNVKNFYLIDFKSGTATIDKISSVLSSKDYFLEGGKPFLLIDFYKRFFGLDLKYSPRRLRVDLPRTQNIPAILSMQRRKRIEQQQAKRFIIPKPDLYLGRNVTLLGAGRFDWTLSSVFSRSRTLSSRHNYNLGIHFLGGDLTTKFIGSTQQNRYHDDWRLQWRYPFLDNPYIQQIIVGDFATNNIKTLALTGIEITNRPLAQKFYFTKEVFSGQFEPKIDVEANDVVLGYQYKQTDQAGNYTFDMPLIYGIGYVDIKAYDPFGQVQVLRYRINVPITLVQPGKIEYSLSVGRARKPLNYTDVSSYFNWGLTNALTIGADIEYFNIDQYVGKIYPGISATARLTHGLTLYGLAAPTAYSRLDLRWVFPSNVEISATGTRYTHNEFMNPSNLINDFRFFLKLPYEDIYRSLSLNLSGSQTINPYYRDREVQGNFTTTFSSFAPSISHQISWRKDYNYLKTAKISERSILSAGISLPSNVLLRADMTYDHLLHSIEVISGSIFKSVVNNFQLIFSFYRFQTRSTIYIPHYVPGSTLPPNIPSNPVLPIGYENYDQITLHYKFTYYRLQVQYYIPFVKTLSGVLSSGSNNYQYSVQGSGSTSFDPETPNLFFDNRPNFVGYGGVYLNPYYDVNGNGIFDGDDQAIKKARFYSANVTRNTNPFTVSQNNLKLFRLQGYEEYDIYLDSRSLENPMWTLTNGSMRVLTEPNNLKEIDIPVVTGGVIRGTVDIKTDTSKIPGEGINVILTSETNGLKAGKKFTASSFSTGEYEFIGVPPGSYLLKLDEQQLSRLGFSSQPAERYIQVAVKPEGDLIEKMNFTLMNK